MSKFTRERALERKYVEYLSREFSKGNLSRGSAEVNLNIGTVIKMVSSSKDGVFMTSKTYRGHHIRKDLEGSDYFKTLLACIAYAICLKNIKFLSADPKDIKDNPEKYIYRFCDIKFVSELNKIASIPHTQTRMPDDVEIFKKLLTNILDENYALLKMYQDYLPSEAKDNVGKIKSFINILKSKIENDASYIAELHNARKISNNCETINSGD